MIAIEIRSRKGRTLLKRKLPTDWREMTASQMMRVVEVAFDGRLIEPQRRARMLRKLLIRGWWDVRAQWALYLAPADHLAVVASRLQYLSASFRTPTWHIEVINGRNGQKLVAPQGLMLNVTLEEFALAERMAERYQKTGDIEDLERLITVLYRPTLKDLRRADPRQPLSLSRIGDYDRIVTAAPKRMKLAIWVNYQGNRNALMDYFPRLFPRIDPQERAPDTSEQKSGKLWDRLHLQLAGTTLGTSDRVKQQPIWDVLAYMDEKLQEQQKQKKNRKHRTA